MISVRAYRLPTSVHHRAAVAAPLVVLALFLGPAWVALTALFVSLAWGAGVLAAWLLLAWSLVKIERRWRRGASVPPLIHPRLWMALPWLGSLAGTIRTSMTDVLRAGQFVLLPAALVIALAWGSRPLQLALLGVCVLVFLIATITAGARRQVIVGDFAETKSDPAAEPSASGVDLADILRGEIARLADLLHVVGDRRAVDSGLAAQSALDATLSVDELSDFFKGPVIAESKFKLAGVTIPLAPVLQLAGRLMSSPRITGRLHRDGDVLILTAQTTRGRRVSWRVDGEAADDDAATAPHPAARADMVRELSLRIYTDLALDQRVRWNACQHFVEGLRCFRSCLRTPKDRKVNLRKAEDAFLDALAEDEDFPLAYYNLGIVYTELLGLAEVAGRREEAKMRLSAAETSFGRAIEKAPSRWDCQFAFAQTQLRRGHNAVVVELCKHMLRWSSESLLQQARTRELLARAHVESDPGLAQLEARRAVELALRHLMSMRCRRQSLRSADDLRAAHAADVVSACLLTYGRSFVANNLHTDIGKTDSNRLQVHVARISSLLARLGDSRPEFQYSTGGHAIAVGQLDLAAEQLEYAVRSVPTRPDYAADLARCLAMKLAQDSGTGGAEARHRVLSPAYRALQAMAGTFSPAHDIAACETVAEVFAVLARSGHPPADDVPTDEEMSRYFRALATKLNKQVKDAPGAMSRSGLFLRELQGRSVRPPANLNVTKLVGPYGRAAHQAFEALVRGQAKKYPEPDMPVPDDRAYRADFKRALEHAYRATSLNPLSTFAWETQGDIFAEFRDFENAREAWQRALLTDPDNPHLYDKIGLSHWNLAFEGDGARLDVESLERARQHFVSALALYGSDDLAPRTLTHYRLGKLSAAIGDLQEARTHFQIVEATDNEVPLVGWVLLGLALLKRSRFGECEYYFRKVTTDGSHCAARIADPRAQAQTTVGDQLDEWLWPLALTRAWGHAGLALSLLERQADRHRIQDELTSAEGLLSTLYSADEDTVSHVRYPSRISGTIAEIKARLPLLQPNTDLEQATESLEKAVSLFPYSRTYLVLADVLERRSRGSQGADAEFFHERAETLRHHAEAFRVHLVNGAGGQA